MKGASAKSQGKKIRQLTLDGIGRRSIEAEIGRDFTAAEERIYLKAKADWIISERQRKAAKAKNVKSKANRERDRRNKENELVIPPCANPARRSRCEKSLAAFLETYCMEDGGFLESKPHPSMYPIIDAIQNALTSSGWYHIRMPRGHGKTSFVKGGLAYALAYGFRRYVILVAASAENASDMLRDVYNFFEQSETFAADFPEISVPFRALGGKTQRAKSLTVGGKACKIRINATEVKLPTVAGYPSSGGIINAIGFGGKARGKVRGKLRPDLVVFDDLQDESLAQNQVQVIKAINTIDKNFLNLGSHHKAIAALMTSTPIEPEDLSERYARDESWYTTTFKMVKSFPLTKDTLWAEYASIMKHERFLGRRPYIAGNKFYRDHRADMDKGAEILNPDNYDRAVELSGIQHAMNLYFKGESQFMSEYQMQPKRQEVVFELTPAIIIKRARKECPPWFIPKESVMSGIATDLNPAYGYSSVACSFDRFATGIIPYYGIHRTNLHRERMTEADYRSKIYDELVRLADELLQEITSRKIQLDYWAIDAGGDQFPSVQRFWRNAKALGITFDVIPMLGKAGRNWNPFVRSRIKAAINNTVECGDVDRDGNKQRWTNFDADYWREVEQRAWLGEIGTPGGLSLFGANDVRHDDFALQVSAEQLKAKIKLPDGRFKCIWEGGETKRHDYGDGTTMVLAAAGSRGLTQGVEFVERATRKKGHIVIL